MQLHNTDILTLQNNEAETHVLGSILLDPDAFERVQEILVPEAFYMVSHQEIYRAAAYLHSKGRGVDLIAVADRLKCLQLLANVGGVTYLRSLVEDIPNTINVDGYAQIVADRYVRRSLYEAGNEIVKIATNPDLETADVQAAVDSKIQQWSDSSAHSGLVPAADGLSVLYDQIERHSQDSSGLYGIPTGFWELDTITQGLGRSDLIIVAGRPSMGKTAMALNIAHNIAHQSKLPALIFSLEMSREQLLQRMLVGQTRIENHRLQSGNVTAKEWDRLINAIGEMSDLPMLIDDTPNPSVGEILSKSKRAWKHYKELGVIVIDYLQLMGGSSKDQNRTLELARITRSLKGVAKELSVPVILLSQLSRGLESRPDKRPKMSDLRDSGAIEQDADLIMMLYRDEYYNSFSLERGIAEVIITKYRNGATGAFKLFFENQFIQFRNLVANG